MEALLRHLRTAWFSYVVWACIGAGAALFLYFVFFEPNTVGASTSVFLVLWSVRFGLFERRSLFVREED